ncbi:MAG TPA: hypothetical protein VF472_04395 [Burkholderiaceae bacterium]
MSQISPSENPSASHYVPGRTALLQATADAIGLNEESKQTFANSGRLYSDGIEFEIHVGKQQDATLRVVASAIMPRPEDVEPEAWHDAMLRANAAAMIVAEWGFALDEGDTACLLMNLPATMQEPTLLRAALEGMHDLCVAVRTGSKRRMQ